MSIEYTLDIQLTELGFPDLLQSQEASTRETPRHSSSNESLSPTTRTRAQKRKLLDAEKASAAKKSSVLSAPSQSETQPPPQPQPPLLLLLPPQPPPPNAKHPSPAQKSLQNKQKQACKDTEVSQPGGDDPTAGPQTTDDPQQNPEEKRGGQNDGGAAEDLDDDSDDSEVSNVYEEEEIDEEDDYEEKDDPDNESSHSGEYRCSVCDLLFTSKFKLQDHMNLHTGARPYCCAECGKRFCQIYNYRVHLRTHAQVKLHRLQCRICLMCFVSDEDLKEHLGRIHTEDKFYECDLCKRVFACLKACESHVQLHKCMLEAVCETCGRNFSSSKSLARHRRKCHRSLKCTDCTKTFTKKNALLKHSFSHLGLLPYTCIRCRCHFRLAKLYRQHKCEPERIHCVACLREFLSQEDFQQHKKDTGCWGNQQPEGDEIRCLECGERFDSKEELKKHAGAHQRILKCAECGKGFRSALLLMSHMGGHAGKSPCLCQSCGLGFPHQQNYDSHLKTCGQTPQPASTSKKRSTSKSSSSEAKKLSTKPGSSNPTTKVPTASTSSTSSTSSASTTSSTTLTSTTTKTATKNPTATTTMLPTATTTMLPTATTTMLPTATTTMLPTATTTMLPTATTTMLPTATTKTLPAAPPPPPVSVSPGLVPDVSGSGSSDGLWKLTLNKQPPPGVKLVLFLPVGPTQADGLPLPPALPQMLPVPAATVQVQHPIASNRHLGGVAAAALGLPLHTPLDLVTGIPPDPRNEEPLDLSRGTVGAHLCKIKEEPQEFEIKREANGADGKVKCEDTEVKPLKMDPMDPSSLSSSSLLITNVKSLGSDAELKSFELTHCKPEKEIKIEVDVSHPEIKRE